MIQESIPAEEDHYCELLTEMLRAKMIRENPGTMHRDAHPKQHGLVKARFSVSNNLAPEFCVGVFQPGVEYNAWVRFSNQNAPPQADNKKDIRGAAIKLLNVEGEKISVADGNQTSQDFITITTPVFVTHDVKEFCGLIKALVTGKLALLWHFLRNPRSLFNLLKSNKNYSSPLNARYWSTTPYLFGADKVVKYSLIPQSRSMIKNESQQGDNFLRENMAKQLQDTTCSFDFCVQVQINPKKMPIEDPGKLWKESLSPFIKLATLTIPPQIFDTEEQNAYGLKLSFNPWHSLPAHQPLGGINRARRKIYNSLSEFRHKTNHWHRQEPIDFNIPTATESPCPTSPEKPMQ